ncbi:DUF1203 domain-containing protein [Paucibacter sp. APW11]|uniref:DUF1203 domain-containing protein n=1 Tax=Roseateles aquae TaxID=3077235 RepID=A0ABU3PGZ4_9BURK|nr:DUF1203 domain-containing protein [Paucibacter sp. APW11]MDT9001670.1 DUF1203 domain-containing protein [Paucibacter sp. APW11]
MPSLAAFIPYRTAPIRSSFVQRARLEGVDDQNQPVERHIAQGGEPCRDALRRALPGEALILASYCPFERAGPYREYGPVFLLADPSAAPQAAEALPMAGEQPYLGRSFALRAYSAEERIVYGQVVSVEHAEARLQALLARPEVAFVLARFAGYGCYACRIERA